MKPLSPDAGIPLLTEIIAVPARPESPGAPPAQADIQGQARAPDSVLSRDEFNRLADMLLEKLLVQLQSRVDTLLEERLEAQLSEQLQTVAAHVARDIRADVQSELAAMIGATRAKSSNNPDFTKK